MLRVVRCTRLVRPRLCARPRRELVLPRVWANGGARFCASNSDGAPEKGQAADEGAASEGAAAAGAAEEKDLLLYALPLFRKPAFPGFYHAIYIDDQEIMKYFMKLKSSNKFDFLAGFMTVDLPRELADAPLTETAAPLLSVPPPEAKESQPRLRKDTGKVANADALMEVGTKLQVISLKPANSGGTLVVMPLQRIRRVGVISNPTKDAPLCAVEAVPLPTVPVGADDAVARALNHEMVATMKELLKLQFVNKEPLEQVIKYYNVEDALKLADLVAGMSSGSRQDLQEVLACEEPVERLKKVLLVLKKDLVSTRLQSQLKTQIEDRFAKENKKFILTQQLRYIKRELNLERDDKQSIIAAFKESIKELGDKVPEEAAKAMDQELSRLGGLEPQSAEFNVCRTYLEWLTALPWGKFSEDNTDIDKAERILNEDHYSLEDVKERILEHMAVSFLKGEVHGKIMCLVGPPGVGKTSIGKSVARALDRQFFRFSVGGLHDVSEIRGHRRTYVGAMPGKIIQALKIKQVSNPVILVDEVDKLGRDFRGDPSSALLEVLDPEQNAAFRDLYLDVPFDLSKVLFICTANVTDTIPGPLLDRMEVIRLAGYVYEEKLAIANQYLVPQTIASNGVAKELLDLQPEALAELIRNYAREAGVRELRKLLEKITRKVALSLVRVDEEARERSVISLENLRKFVGQPPHSSERLFQDSPSGVAMGLAWTALGGKTLFVEARGRVPASNERMADANVSLKATATAEGGGEEAPAPSRARNSGPRMKVTGKLGKVMGESSEIALTYAKIFLRELEPKNEFLDMAYIHMNMPEGAISKDGPSAGVTMTSALLSMALDRPVKRDLAMSGEVTLTGKVLRVGGIKEKTLAAKRENVDRLVLPMSNQADYLELKPYLRAGLTAHFVDHYDDVYRLAFQDTGAPMPEGSRGSEVVTVVTPEEEKTPLMMSQATVADSATAAV
ncbi:unnamed protein product [Effrenium voratum]|nr:unnamed protein product [Effrenium voratum]